MITAVLIRDHSLLISPHADYNQLIRYFKVSFCNLSNLVRVQVIKNFVADEIITSSWSICLSKKFSILCLTHVKVFVWFQKRHGNIQLRMLLLKAFDQIVPVSIGFFLSLFLVSQNYMIIKWQSFEKVNSWDEYIYGSDSPGRGFWPKCGIFFEKK